MPTLPQVPLYASQVLYVPVQMTADTFLEWSSLGGANSPYCGRMMDVSSSTTNLVLVLPPLNNLTEGGRDTVIKNIGAAQFLITDAESTFSITVTAGQAFYLYISLTEGLTLEWNSFQWFSGDDDSINDIFFEAVTSSIQISGSPVYGDEGSVTIGVNPQLDQLQNLIPNTSNEPPSGYLLYTFGDYQKKYINNTDGNIDITNGIGATGGSTSLNLVTNIALEGTLTVNNNFTTNSPILGEPNVVLVGPNVPVAGGVILAAPDVSGPPVVGQVWTNPGWSIKISSDVYSDVRPTYIDIWKEDGTIFTQGTTPLVFVTSLNPAHNDDLRVQYYSVVMDYSNAEYCRAIIYGAHYNSSTGGNDNINFTGSFLVYCPSNF